MKKLAILTLVAALVAPAMALTGNPFADGWTYGGSSLENGVYVRSNSGQAAANRDNIGFGLYTTSFTVTDSSIFAITGHDDASYLSYYETTHWTKANARTWQVGHNVIGIGGVFAGISTEDAGWDAFTGKAVNSTIDGVNSLRLQAKIGTADAAWSTSTIAPAAGNGSGSSSQSGTGGLFVRTSGWHSLAAWENFSGTMLGLQKTSHIEATGISTPNVDVARVIWTWDETADRPGTWQLLVNLSLVEADYATLGYTGLLPGQIGDKVIGSVQITNAGYTDALAIVPEPATMVLLGLGAVGLLRKRK